MGKDSASRGVIYSTFFFIDIVQCANPLQWELQDNKLETLIGTCLKYIDNGAIARC
jgi:hypothetical protein